MAKLKGPLFSLGASQQLGKALVYFPWKGLNVVREYVIPSNPKTTLQTTQRGYLKDAVTAIHSAQAAAANPLDAEDVSAYALWASVVQTATTWFNQLVRNIVDRLVAGGQWIIWRDGHLTPGTDKLTFVIHNTGSVGGLTTMNIKYGTSKTALIHTQATTALLLIAGVDITGLTTGVKYYVQVHPVLAAVFIGSYSGIYHGVPT